MASFVNGLFHIFIFGLFYFLIRGFYFVFTKKEITIAKRAQGINITSAFLSLAVNIVFIFFWLPRFVWGNYKSMVVYFLALALVYLLFKYLFLRKKAWRNELLQYEKDLLASFLFALPMFALFAVGMGFLFYIGFHFVIYLFAGLTLLILVVAFCPWLLLFFI